MAGESGGDAAEHRRAGRWLAARWLVSLSAIMVLVWPEPVLATTADDVIERFSECGLQVGDQDTVYAVDGSPTTILRVWTDDQRRDTRGLVVYIYADAETAEDVFHVLSSVDKLEGVDAEPTPDNGPLLERGAGRSVWRGNVAVAQIMPLTSPSDLDAVPDADLVRCLDGMP
jgi:hypothetical protein